MGMFCTLWGIKFAMLEGLRIPPAYTKTFQSPLHGVQVDHWQRQNARYNVWKDPEIKACIKKADELGTFIVATHMVSSQVHLTYSRW